MNRKEFEEKFNIHPSYTSPDSNGQTVWQWIEQYGKEQRVDELERITAILPTTWLDSLLTGKDKIIGEAPFSCQDIETIYNHIRIQAVNRIKELNETSKRPM